MTLLRRLLTREVLTFLAVGGAGYVVDVVTFTELLGTRPFSGWDPNVARLVAVAVAMVVTFVGNAALTWRGRAWGRREVAWFVLLNLVGLGFSSVCLTVSHDLLGLTSRLADNLSANVVGLALGTVFRFLTYRLLVFREPAADPDRQSGGRQVEQVTVVS
ncbi:MAG: GtrA family protein [Aeromicrobium erythreum]